jgi:hypothetical protein
MAPLVATKRHGVEGQSMFLKARLQLVAFSLEQIYIFLDSLDEVGSHQRELLAEHNPHTTPSVATCDSENIENNELEFQNVALKNKEVCFRVRSQKEGWLKHFQYKASLSSKTCVGLVLPSMQSHHYLFVKNIRLA